MLPAAHLQTLTELCNTPVAPYREQHAFAAVLSWADATHRRSHLAMRRDPAGNVYLDYRFGTAVSALPPLVIEAHMDHPGFLATGVNAQGQFTARFRGAVRPSHFRGATAAFWLNDPPATGSIAPVRARGRWVPAKIIEAVASQVLPGNSTDVTFEPPPVAIPPGTLGMWHLPDALVQGELFCARVCDDLAGVAAALCMLDDLIAQQIDAPITVLLTRAEEVAFAGAIAVAENGWIPPGARVIGLETSKGSAYAPQGGGPIVRVGDRIGIFSPGLTHFISQAAAFIGDDDPSFHFQRKLMDGGTCNSTTFAAFGYDSAGLCIALGNYHNMTAAGELGYGQAPTCGPGIGSETIHLGDFDGLVRTLVSVARRYPTYQPGFAAVRGQLSQRHAVEQKQPLYSTSDQPTAAEYLPKT